MNIFVKKEEKLQKFDRYLNKSKLLLPIERDYAKSSYHLYVFFKKSEKNLRNKLIHYLKNQGIYTNIHYKPIHLQTYYKNFGFKKHDFKNADHIIKEL